MSSIPSPYPVPASEDRRLADLADYDLMDSSAEEDFDRLVALASRLLDVPIGLISLIGSERQFFKAGIGIDTCETSRESSFCSHAIMQDDILLVPDATRDPRFVANPAVLGPPFVRFYAGKPLITPSGERIGVVCLIDSVPRPEFTENDRTNLIDPAALVMDRMEMWRLEHIRSISQTRFENIAATSPDAIICSDSGGHITFWNRAAEKLFGFGEREIFRESAAVIVPDVWRRFYDAELARIQNGEHLELEVKSRAWAGRM